MLRKNYLVSADEFHKNIQLLPLLLLVLQLYINLLESQELKDTKTTHTKNGLHFEKISAKTISNAKRE